MTSSEDLPAGISCAVTTWALLEYQMVIGPLVVAASLLVPPPEPQAVSTRAPARMAAAAYLEGRVRRGRFMAGPSLFGVELLMAVSAWWFGGPSGGYSGTRAP